MERSRWRAKCATAAGVATSWRSSRSFRSTARSNAWLRGLHYLRPEHPRDWVLGARYLGHAYAADPANGAQYVTQAGEILDTDILPVDDFGVREGYRLAAGLEAQPKPKALAEIGLAWAPYRSAAAWYLWRAADLAKEGRFKAPAAI